MGIWYGTILAYGTLISNPIVAFEYYCKMQNLEKICDTDSVIEYIEIINDNLDKRGLPFKIVYSCPYYDCQDLERIKIVLSFKPITMEDIFGEGKSIDLENIESFNNKVYKQCLLDFNIKLVKPELFTLLHVC